MPFLNNVNFSHQPAEVAEVTSKSRSVGAEWGRETDSDPSSPQQACTPGTAEGGRLLWLFVTGFDSLLFVVTEQNFLVTKLIVFDGVN